MPGSRLLPPERRSSLPEALTTTRWWRTHVLLRSWANRHRHRWLAPLLLCAPPVGLAMVWAGATRPGHTRRWLTAAALVWSLVVLLTVVLVTSAGAPPADADNAPRRPVAGGAPLATPSASSTPTRDTAPAAAEVRGAPARGEGVAGAGVAAPSNASGGGSSSVGRSAPAGSTPGAGGAAAPAAPAPPSATPRRSSGPARTEATPTPTPTPRRTPTRAPDPPSLPTANPFSSCSVEGAHAVSPNGFALRCFRTPIGLYWLWGQ